MKFYGHANLQQNELQNAALTTLTAFPTGPVIGQLAFVNSIVYICVGAGELPVWVPLTREITAYTHTQGTAASTWTVTHNLNTTEVNFQVYDGANNVIIPDGILASSSTTAIITFGSAIAGRVVCVTGSFEGNAKPAYAYTFYQNSAATTWTINHNLGHNPIVRVFIGVDEVQPATISHPTTNQTVITFTTAQAGYARLL
jgi:hypothetical protein